MSSLAAARADNFYFPPEWRPEYGGISKFAGSKGANQYEKYGIIRFELPFDAWCLKCNLHMSKGLRFNAKKDKAGKYFTTQIYSFEMKCYDCSQTFVILTDPQNNTYNYKEGLRKHEQDFEPDVDDSIIVANSEETRQLLASDPMFRLQHQNEDVRKAMSESERFVALSELREQHYKQDYDNNSLLRNKSRKVKRRDIELRKEATSKGLAVTLLEPSEEDQQEAKKIRFAPKISAEMSEAKRLASLKNESIFSGQGDGKGLKPNHNSSKATTGVSNKLSSSRSVVPRDAGMRVSSTSSSSSTRAAGVGTNGSGKAASATLQKRLLQISSNVKLMPPPVSSATGAGAPAVKLSIKPKVPAVK